MSVSSEIVSGSETLLDFPLEVRTTDSDFAQYAQISGNDFLFTASDGHTKLDHEIRDWNPSTGHLVATVKVPVLSPTEDTVLFLYYGNPGCPDQQNRTGVWSDYEYHQYFHKDPNAGSQDEDNTIKDDRGTPLLLAFLEAQKRILEGLFGCDWFYKGAKTIEKHPAFKRWQLCDLLLQRAGRFRFPEDNELLPRLARMLADNRALVWCTAGDVSSFSLGSIANYGDSAVLRRLRSEIGFPSKYLDIQTELSWAAWHLQQGHSVMVYETAGVDHRIDIPGWELPVLSDCKRIAPETLAARVRWVIKKANQQIKRHKIPCYGVAVVDLSAKLPIYDLQTLSDNFPPELTACREAAIEALRAHYSSVSAVVLFWNEVAILGPEDGTKKILVNLRTRSELVQNQHSTHAFGSNLDLSRLRNAGEVQFSITLQARNPQASD